MVKCYVSVDDGPVPGLNRSYTSSSTFSSSLLKVPTFTTLHYLNFKKSSILVDSLRAYVLAALKIVIDFSTPCGRGILEVSLMVVKPISFTFSSLKDFFCILSFVIDSTPCYNEQLFHERASNMSWP